MHAPLPHIAKRVADKGEVLSPVAPKEQSFPRRLTRYAVRCTALATGLGVTIGGLAEAFSRYGTNANWLWAAPLVGGAIAALSFEWGWDYDAKMPSQLNPDSYRRAKIWCSALGFGLPAGVALGLKGFGAHIGVPGAMAMVGTALGAQTAAAVWAFYEARGRLAQGHYNRQQKSVA